MINLSGYKETFKRLPEGVVEAEVNVETHDVHGVEVHGGTVTGNDQSEQRELYLRVSGKKTGYLYTQNVQDDPLTLLREACHNSLYSERPTPDEIHRGTDAVRKDYGCAVAMSDPGLLIKKAAGFEEVLLSCDRRITDVFVSLRAETVGSRTLNSHGLDVRSIRPLYILSVTVNSILEGRLYAGTYNRTARVPEDFDADDFVGKVRELLDNRYDQKPFRSGSYRAVLHRNAVYNIMSTAWQFFSGHRYLEGSSMLSGKLGKKVAAECLKLGDYPVHRESGFVIPCDCEGSPGAAACLLEGGMLSGLMHNLATAKALGAEPTGNAGRRPLLYGNIATDIVVTPRNFCIEPGDASLDELIEHLADGVLITETSDVFHSINIASGAFSIPCRGILVRDGEKISGTGPLALHGNMKDFFLNIEEIGNDFYIGTMLALNNYGIGVCSLRMKELDVAGDEGKA